MQSTIREILKNQPQLFILNYFHRINEQTDWALVRREPPYNSGEIRMLHSLWRNQVDPSLILSVKMIENPSALVSIVNLKEVARQSAGRQLSEEGVMDPKQQRLLGSFAPRFFIPEAQLKESPERLTAIKYALGNMTVEINSVGPSPCYLTQIQQLAKHFFLIPDLAMGKIEEHSIDNFRVTSSGSSEVFELHLPDPGNDTWYMVLLNQPAAQIYRSADRLLVTPGTDEKESLAAYVLRVHRTKAPVICGPVAF